MELINRDAGYLTTTETGFPRVPQQVYIGIFIAFVPLCAIAVGSRIYVRVRNRGRLDVDDAFIIGAFCCSMAAWGVAWQIRELIYLSVELVVGMAELEPEDTNLMLSFFKYYNASMVLTWTAIYLVKFSFLFFFRKLISRVRSLEIYWWVIMGVQIPTYLFSAYFSFYVCSDLTLTYLENCSINSMMQREEVYLYLTTALDIFTDILVISLPLLLVMKVQINLKRKIFLGMALCLSIFMIIIAIIRITTSKLPGGTIDTVWLALWQCVETNTGIILVSLTAFRSLFASSVSPGQSRRGSSRRPFWPIAMNIFRRGTQSNPQKEANENYQELPGIPCKAMMRSGCSDDTRLVDSKSGLARSQKVQGDTILSEDPRDEEFLSWNQTSVGGREADEAFHPCQWPSVVPQIEKPSPLIWHR